MALTKSDKQDIREIFNEGVTQVMMPVLDKILTKQDEHSKDIATIKKDVSVLKEDLSDVQLTVNRIETRQKAEVERVDDHQVRIVKLEKKIA